MEILVKLKMKLVFGAALLRSCLSLRRSGLLAGRLCSACPGESSCAVEE